MADRPSRLGTCCAVVSRAMGGRDPGALAASAAGEPGRALALACNIGPEPPPATCDRPGAQPVDPGWWAEPAGALPGAARAAFVGMLPPLGRRIASAVAPERAGAPGAGADPGWRSGETLSSLMRILRPPTMAGPSPGPAPGSGEKAMADNPEEAASIARMIARALPPGAAPGDARDLAALAAGLAGDADAAEALALAMPRRAGAAFLVARSRWSLLLVPEDAGVPAGRAARGG